MNSNKFEVLVKLPWYTEGPVVDNVGNIFFTTLKGKLILKIDIRGKLSEWTKAECPNGQIIDPDGDHLVCDTGTKSVTRYNSSGRLVGYDVKDNFAGENIHSPNDLVMDAHGGIFFTDSVRNSGKVCYYQPGGEEKIIANGLDFPNGIAIADNGGRLLVAESYKNRILSFDIHNNYESSVFAVLPQHRSGAVVDNLPDGIKIDESGHLWVAHYGMGCLQVLSREGDLLKSIQVDFPLASNLFIDKRHLIVTGGFGEPGPGGLLQMSI